MGDEEKEAGRELHRFHLQLPVDLYRRLRIHAAEEDTTAAKMARRFIEEGLAKPKKK